MKISYKTLDSDSEEDNHETHLHQDPIFNIEGLNFPEYLDCEVDFAMKENRTNEM